MSDEKREPGQDEVEGADDSAEANAVDGEGQRDVDSEVDSEVDSAQESAHDGTVEVEASVEVTEDSADAAEAVADHESSATPESEADKRAQRSARGKDIPQDVRQMAMFMHLLGLANYVVPFGGIIGPLVLWQMKREEHPFLDQQGRSAVNFNLTAGLAILCCLPLVFLFIGVPLVALISVGANVLAILAGLAANDGKSYRYPFKFDFVK